MKPQTTPTPSGPSHSPVPPRFGGQPGRRSQRLLAAVAAIATLTAVVVAVPSTASANGCGTTSDFAGGSGTAGDPYLVSTPTQLQAIGSAPNLSCAYLVTNDLDLSGNAPWSPIGTFEAEFTGSFDGGGFTLSGLVVTENSTTTGQGLFGRAVDATLENVRFDGATLFAAQEGSSSGGQIGTLVGRAVRTAVRDIEVTGVVRISSTEDVGGVVGRGLDTTIERVLVDADIVITALNNGRGKIGGVVGQLFSEDPSATQPSSQLVVTALTIRTDPATSTNANRTGETGGLIGSLRGSLRDSAADNIVITTEGTQRRLDYSGGAVGYVSSGTSIERVSATSVSIPGGPGSDEAVGGLLGQFDAYGMGATIRYSYASGVIGGPNDEEVGGLIGELRGSLLVEDSYANVDVAGAAETATFIGNLVTSGFEPDEIEFATLRRTYASGSLSGGSGGFIGELDIRGDFAQTPVVEASFWDTTTSGRDTSAGNLATGLPTAPMQSLATFDDAGWAIVEGWVPFNPSGTPAAVWGICAGYPFLLWEFSQTVDVTGCAPPPPVSLTPTLTGTDVTFSWTPGDGPNATSYRVTLNPGGASCEAIAPVTTCTIAGLEPGGSYTATATATNDFGTSEASNTVEFTVPTQPTTTTTTPDPTPTTAPSPTTAPDRTLPAGTTAGGDLPKTGVPTSALWFLGIGLVLLLTGIVALALQRLRLRRLPG
jgi:LPXTG-motif cell wall-anchored protein